MQCYFGFLSCFQSFLPFRFFKQDVVYSAHFTLAYSHIPQTTICITLLKKFVMVTWWRTTLRDQSSLPPEMLPITAQGPVRSSLMPEVAVCLRPTSNTLILREYENNKFTPSYSNAYDQKMRSHEKNLLCINSAVLLLG